MAAGAASSPNAPDNSTALLLCVSAPPPTNIIRGAEKTPEMIRGFKGLQQGAREPFRRP
jgi:hypothetical protein